MENVELRIYYDFMDNPNHQCDVAYRGWHEAAEANWIVERNVWDVVDEACNKVFRLADYEVYKWRG